MDHMLSFWGRSPSTSWGMGMGTDHTPHGQWRAGIRPPFRRCAGAGANAARQGSVDGDRTHAVDAGWKRMAPPLAGLLAPDFWAHPVVAGLVRCDRPGCPLRTSQGKIGSLPCIGISGRRDDESVACSSLSASTHSNSGGPRRGMDWRQRSAASGRACGQ